MDLLDRSELLVLPLRSEAPEPATTSFWVFNSQQTTHLLLHADDFNTPYLELVFAANSVRSAAGTALGSADSVWVTVDPWPGAYGFSLTPTDLEFSANAAPVATFFFGLYGDASVASTTPTYTDPAAYVASLAVWHEIDLDGWRVVAGSHTVGPDVVSSSVSEPGEYALAAVR